MVTGSGRQALDFIRVNSLFISAIRIMEYFLQNQETP